MGWESLLIELLKAAYDSELRKKLFSKTTFLNYDIKWLIDYYDDEEILDTLVPYSEIVRWLQPSKEETHQQVSQIKLCITEDDFQLSAGTSNLEAFQGEALAMLKRVGKMTSNERIIHLEKVEVDKDETRLFIQPAYYKDQAKSNLVMDWEGPHTLYTHNGIKTLRAYLSARYRRRLPPLNDHILANTLGISAIILYRDGRELVPYLPQRVGRRFKDFLKETGRTPQNVAVFEGGYHCTASGAAQWGHGLTFEDCIMDDMYSELEEEVGIEKKHIDIMIPVALCRELLRAGKPQIFFVGITNRSRKELDDLRVEAIRRTLKLGMVPEIHDDAKTYQTGAELYNKLKQYGLTIEASANLHYVEDFVEVYGKF